MMMPTTPRPDAENRNLAAPIGGQPVLFFEQSAKMENDGIIFVIDIKHLQDTEHAEKGASKDHGSMLHVP